MVDIVVRGEQNGRQFAGQADQGPVEDCLLLSLDRVCLPPEFSGPQDGGDTPSEPLGRLPLPHLVFGILHGHMLLPWDFLLWPTEENSEEKGKRVSRFIRYDTSVSYNAGKSLVYFVKTYSHFGLLKWKSNVILEPPSVITGSACLQLVLVLVLLTERSLQQVLSSASLTYSQREGRSLIHMRDKSLFTQ